MIMLIKLGDLWKFRIGQVDAFRQSPQVQEENVNKTRGFVQTVQRSAAQCSAAQCSAVQRSAVQCNAVK